MILNTIIAYLKLSFLQLTMSKDSKTPWYEVVDSWRNYSIDRIRDEREYNTWTRVHPDRFRYIHVTSEGNFACGTKYDPFDGNSCTFCKAKKAHKSEAQALTQYWKEY